MIALQSIACSGGLPLYLSRYPDLQTTNASARRGKANLWQKIERERERADDTWINSTHIPVQGISNVTQLACCFFALFACQQHWKWLLISVGTSRLLLHMWPSTPYGPAYFAHFRSTDRPGQAKGFLNLLACSLAIDWRHPAPARLLCHPGLWNVCDPTPTFMVVQPFNDHGTKGREGSGKGGCVERNR